MKNIISAALALGIAALPVAAQDAPKARPEAPGPREGRAMAPRMQERMAKALGLTDDQKAKIKAIREKHQEGAEARRKASREARKAFMDAYGKSETSVEELRRLHRAAADAQMEALLDHRAQRDEIRALLTPEQREKAARFRGFMEGMMSARRQGRPGMGRGMEPGMHPGMGMRDR